MTTSKKPDAIVFNDETQAYDASLKAYGTNIGAPSITTVDTVNWKNRNIQRVNKHMAAKFNEIKSSYDSMMKEFEMNQLVYSAKFNFEPLVGETYHLYRTTEDTCFLSIIDPDECSFDFIGSFYLDSNLIWRSC